MTSLILAAGLCCSVTGTVHGPSGAAIAQATIEVGGPPAVRATSDAHGAFSLTAQPGPRAVTITAPGYGATTIDRVDVHEGTALDVTLEPIRADELQTVGRVTVDGRLALPRGSTPSVVITRNAMNDDGIQVTPDALFSVPSVTLVRPDSGGQAAVSVVALRGPDPSETLTSLDGQLLNNTNTGDFDISQFPAMPLAAIDVTEGLGPESAVGANTIGGEVNFRTLAPTTIAHSLFTASYGSYGTSALGLNTTGTFGRLGYALAGSDMHTQGNVLDYPATFIGSSSSTTTTNLNSWVGAQTGLANLTWTFSQRADVHVRYFVLNNVRDLSGALNAPADPSQQIPGGIFNGPGPTTGSQNLNALLVTARAPLGSGQLTASYSSSGTNQVYAGAPTVSPYDLSYDDKLSTLTVGWERSVANFDMALGGYTRNETLTEPQVFDAVQGQHSEAAYARVGWNAGPRLHLQANGYDSVYTTFGASLDGRLGAVYDIDGHSNARFSVGTGFRAPLLAELYSAPYPVLLATIDANCVAPNGNPDEKPEHVTTYELGYGNQIGSQTTVDASLYYTALRSPIEIFYPLNAHCPPPPLPPTVAGQSIPINISNAVYKGGTLRLGQRWGNLFARLELGLNVAYPRELPETVANPTSGGNLVPFQQFQGIPIQIGTFALDYDCNGFYGNVTTTYRGKNNELNAGPYALVNASIGKRINGIDYWISARNVTNAVAGQFTQLGQGVPYPTPEGQLPTDLFVNQPVTVLFGITLRH